MKTTVNDEFNRSDADAIGLTWTEVSGNWEPIGQRAVDAERAQVEAELEGE